MTWISIHPMTALLKINNYKTLFWTHLDSLLTKRAMRNIIKVNQWLQYEIIPTLNRNHYNYQNNCKNSNNSNKKRKLKKKKIIKLLKTDKKFLSVLEMSWLTQIKCKQSWIATLWICSRNRNCKAVRACPRRILCSDSLAFLCVI